MNVGICVRHAQEGMEEAFAAAVQAAGFQAKVLRPGEVLSI